MSIVSVTVCHAYVTHGFSLQSGESIMVEVAAGPSDSSTHEKVSWLLDSTSSLRVTLSAQRQSS